MPPPSASGIEGNARLTTTASSVTTKNPRTAAVGAKDGAADSRAEPVAETVALMVPSVGPSAVMMEPPLLTGCARSRSILRRRRRSRY